MDERLDRAEQVAERDALVDGEPLDLVEHRRVAGVERVAPEGAPRRDDVDRRWLRLHRAHLHGRRVRAQHHALRVAQAHVERVLHGARRMTGREVERLEVVPVGLDLGAFGDLVAQADEHVFELAPDARDRMQVAAHVLARAEREVEPVAGGRQRGRFTVEDLAPRGVRGFEVGARTRHGLADDGALRSRRRS